MVARATRYGGTAIFLHWTIALLIAGNIALAWWLGLLDQHDPLVEPLLTIHKSIGTTVLVLAASRFGWRLTHAAPPLPLALPGWQRGIARLTHALLYVLMVVMPVSGLIDAVAFTQPVHYFFLFDLPTVIAHNEPLGHAAFAVHKAGAIALYLLLAAHAGAALFHHYVLKDGILLRMLPASGGSEPATAPPIA